MTRIKKDLSLLKPGDDYWKATLKHSANKGELPPLQVSKNFGPVRQETHNYTAENQRWLAELMWEEMKAQVKKIYH
jgi:hypothetical protein